MRFFLVLLGVGTICGYAVLGAWLANDAAIVAGSGMPLADAVSAMDAAGQPYSVIPGMVFAGLGILLAGLWAIHTLHPGHRPVAWASVAAWALIITLGAPAYFYASFANLNSVGDTFYDWHIEAVAATARPLYLASLVALAVLSITLVAAAATRIFRRPGKPQANSVIA